jgi:hypothetical protein
MGKKKQNSQSPLALDALGKHFGKQLLSSLVAASRTFPVTSRADLQLALENIFATTYQAKLIGVHPQYSHESLSTAHLVVEGQFPVFVGPLQHDEVDVGGPVPARCLQHGLWMGRIGKMPFSILLTPAHRFGQERGVLVEVAVPPGEEGAGFSRGFFRQLEELVNTAGTYKGKVISLEATDRYSGHVGVIKVHRLRTVERREVILPARTLELLDRNVGEFIKQRDKLQRLGMPVKKGLLFYGPPGTGKTHTIHYLASQLKEHTTLLITAEQVGFLATYMQLARFLQPAMVVIEDVDLIARDREHMYGPCSESLLNKLLNEMDGLREDASIIFLLTTNRPEQLETALASRPGRVDQAIEFPLPDEEGRRKLIELYAHGLVMDEVLVQRTIKKTRHASAAFIKELMRRSAQYHLEESQPGSLQEKHLDAALEEMLFSGGTLNLKLLGADAAIAEPEIESEEIDTKYRN